MGVGRARKRERKRGGGKGERHREGATCKLMVTNSESQVGHYVVIIHGTCSKIHK